MSEVAGVSSKPVLWRTYMEDFPHLPVEMVSRFNKGFNCISWSIGVTDRWVWDEIDFNADGTSSLGEFLRFYAKHGYKPTSSEDLADVALFALQVGLGAYKVTHASKRDPQYPTMWLSKMGQGGIIRHRDLSVFRESPYGLPIALFRRE